MTFSNGLNQSAATLTKARTGKDISPFSGMCVTCLEGCPGLCEIGKSAIRCKEVLYPQPFGTTTSASQKDYPVDYSHFNIMGTAVGAEGIEADSDKAIFPAVNLETAIGAGENKIKLKLPIIIPGMGSTDIAKNNWRGLAIGAALSGSLLVIGENVCGMDSNCEIVDGKVVHAPELAARVSYFNEFYNGYGATVVQSNVEDTRLGVLEYAIQKLGVEVVELKWGQGAKDIGGEVKLRSLERALELKSKGYIVLPDPELPSVQEAFKAGAFKEFERHSRVGMVEEEAFMKRVQELRDLGAKYVFLKTGAYRPADLARAVRFASIAKIDLLTVDGAGGGTGMSPWRMMNEWGVPTVYIQSLLVKYLDQLKAKGAFVPDVCIAGGFALEDQVFKGLALGAPYIKAVGMARAPLTAAMVGKTIGNQIAEGKLGNELSKFGDKVEQVFISAPKLKDMYGDRFNDIPPAAMGVYSFFERIAGGLQQFMCGARKFNLDVIRRDDLVALTREAAEVSGISYVMDADKEEVEKLLNF